MLYCLSSSLIFRSKHVHPDKYSVNYTGISSVTCAELCMQFSLPCSTSTNNGTIIQTLVTIFKVNCHDNDTEFLEFLGADHSLCWLFFSLYTKVYLKNIPKSQRRSNSSISIPPQDHRTKQYFALPTLYIYLINLHSDIQPVLSPTFFFLLSLISPILYPKYHGEWWRGKKPNFNLHIHVLNLSHVICD